MSQTPSEQCKQAGFESLAELIQLTGLPKRTLIRWHKTKPRLFELVLKGVVSENWRPMTELTDKCLGRDLLIMDGSGEIHEVEILSCGLIQSKVAKTITFEEVEAGLKRAEAVYFREKEKG